VTVDVNTLVTNGGWATMGLVLRCNQVRHAGCPPRAPRAALGCSSPKATAGKATDGKHVKRAGRTMPGALLRATFAVILTLSGCPQPSSSSSVGSSSTSAAQWVTVPGANLDTKGQCGCTGTCRDVAGFHFAGLLGSADACEMTCSEAKGGNCSMWFYSSHSSHCWWKIGEVWAPIATQGITAGCDVSKVPGCGPLPPPPSPPAPPPPPPPAAPCTGNSTALPEAECAAWQSLWWSAGGSGWTNGGDGVGRTDPCSITWPEGGVSCSDAGILRIVLPANNLSGVLPASLSTFTRLERLQVRVTAQSLMKSQCLSCQ
jgi:hypothetical protein